jgi:hypothetical protein
MRSHVSDPLETRTHPSEGLSAEGAPALKRGPVQADEGCVLNATLAISVAALAVGFAALFGPR